MRVFFFPGFAEDEAVLRPLIQEFAASNETIYVDYQHFLDTFLDKPMNMPDFVQQLSSKYYIHENDMLIGHSFGGWVAAHIHQQYNCPTVIIGSFTDNQHVIRRVFMFSKFAQYLTKKGLFKSKWIHKFVRRRYKERPSAPAIEACIQVMKTWKDHHLHQISMLIKAHPPLPYQISPLLRIHGTNDEVISPPSVFYHKIEDGDHHIQYTHAKEIYALVQKWEKNGYEVEIEVKNS
ncbi:MAG: alpha/beta fold hydrolase [Bacteroidia bacterium]